MERRLYRSRENKIIGGVAGGLGEYFDIDPVLVRVIFVVATLASGFGLIAYLLLWIIVPRSPALWMTSDERNEKQKTSAPLEESSHEGSPGAQGETPMTEKSGGHDRGYPKRHGNVVGGTVLIVLGILFLADGYWPVFRFSHTWPLILVAIGIALISGAPRKTRNEGEGHES